MTANHRVLLALLVTVAVAAGAALRLEISYDLSAFLPPPGDLAQSLLTERLGQGAGAQLVFIALEDSNSAEASAIAGELRSHPLISRVLPEELTMSPDSLPRVLWNNRLLLGDLPADAGAWAEVLSRRADDLMFAADDDTLALIAADPALLSIDALSRFAAGASTLAFDQGSTQLLMLETVPAGFELVAQTRLVADIRATLARRAAGAQLLGSPVYAVDLQESVRFEATLFSSIAGIALLLFIVLRFRSPQRVIGVALPLAAGGVSAMLALTFAFDEVHGITLAFGFTLLGVALDYPLHLFIHAEEGTSAGNRNVWKVLRLGILSTCIAYATLIFSGATGLQQLGVFALVGIIAAALTAAWITHRSVDLADTERSPETPPLKQVLRWWPAVTALGVSTAVLFAFPVFNDDLSSLTPVDANLLEADAQLRTTLGVADIRYLVSVKAGSEEEALRASERAVATLRPLQESGKLAGVQSITQILPSRDTQSHRREALDAFSIEAFEAGAAAAALEPAAFATFLEALEDERDNNGFATFTALRDEPALRGAVDNLFFEHADGWVSLVFLRGLTDREAVMAALQSVPQAALLDLKLASENLVADYRSRLVTLLLIALAVIALMLGVRLSLRESLWLLLNAVAAMAFAAACSVVWLGGLSLFNLIALILVTGLGLDYVLFYGRERPRTDDRATASAVLICAVSSLLVFGILSLSEIPVLRSIGATVAAGVIAAYLLARFGRYANTGS